jgi:prepilin-type N-terminal cleavage/methylation domain-containing protein
MAIRPAPQHGHTLTELLLVLAIIGIASAFALPNAEPVKQSILDAAAKEVAQAVRFAQAEAIRTGDYRVVRIDPTTETVRVFALDMGPKPPIEDVANPVSNPIDKKNYSVSLTTTTGIKGSQIISSVFNFSGGSSASQLGFGPDGAPVNVLGPNPPDLKALLGVGQVVLAYGNLQRTLSVDASTGRVTASP